MTKVITHHLMRTKTRNGKATIIVYYFCEGGVIHKEWLMRKHFNRATFFRRNIIEEIYLDYSKNKDFPRISISRMRLRGYTDNTCHHIYIDGCINDRHFICSECKETIDVHYQLIQSFKSGGTNKATM